MLQPNPFIKANLPQYRLTKFQLALPADNSLEMIDDYLLDVSQTIIFLKSIFRASNSKAFKSII